MQVITKPNYIDRTIIKELPYEALSEEVQKFLHEVFKVGFFSFDVEHSPKIGPHEEGFMIDGCSFSCGSITFYERTLASVTTIVKRLFPANVEAVAYNAKYDLKCLVSSGIITSEEYPRNLADPMVAVNLLDDNLRPNELGLDKVVKKFYGYDMLDFKESCSYGFDSPEFTRYTCDDARFEWRLWGKLRERLERDGLLKYFQRVVMPAEKVIADLELRGLRWNIDNVGRLLEGFQELRDKMQGEIYDDIGVLNLNSGDQLARKLYEDLGYSTRGIQETASGKRLSVDAAAMDILAAKYSVAKKIRAYRTATKMINTYIEPLTMRSMEAADGRVHASFWLVSSTGRTRCSQPNLQNIPSYLASEFKNLSLKNNFIPAEDCVFIDADYSQIELRLVAHLSQDKRMLHSYLHWQCAKCAKKGDSPVILHECPNCGEEENEEKGFWHGLDLHQMTTDAISVLEGNRQNGKKANFALVYAAGPKKMHYTYPELSVDQWAEASRAYFMVYTGVANWHRKIEHILNSTRVVRDVFGRKRRIRKS